MTPGARLQAAIELLHAIHAGTSPADRATAAFFRNRRYIGAKDRREVLDRAYAVLRRRAALDWWIWKSGQAPQDRDRARLIASLALLDGWTADRIAGSFDGVDYHPPTLDEAERRIAKTVIGKAIENGEQPADVRNEYPEWIAPLLQRRFGARMDAEMRAAIIAASTDLRVNTVKATRDEAIAALKAEGIVAAPTSLSPVGLRVHGRPPLATLRCFKDGLIEVQDEGSQLVALLVDARPGMRVADFCAGAGGKTLAIAAQMKNKGKIVACDVLEGRIERAAVRFQRAGIHNVERKALSSERDQWVKRHAGTFDRVLVDAPCTGTGTWRRNPDAKWKLTPEDLEELSEVQHNILDSAWRLVKPGGRLVYATCSLLAEENEAQVEAFLTAHADFKLVPIVDVWKHVVGTAPPHSAVIPAEEPGPMRPSRLDDGPMGPGSRRLTAAIRDDSVGSGNGATLSLTPAQHGTDGFFAALLERVKVPK
ncbi:MAG TPA: RsmB/NOP family class I SAM-dependent RNA methyltransferase [Dongiaceae bacterium]|jgi:16S rRNA (cytosine967-C5)-methyltransferase|nr:RsmB/NOP family class I SAM-dependent RNA methyltransferase [Dongiaceae bacterium]